MSWFWLVVRLYLGYEWVMAGWEKISGTTWGGGAIQGFVGGALKQTGGAHPSVQMWYAWFLQHCVLPYASLWSHLIAWGELFVGIGLIIGLFTAVAAFFGAFMNLNYLLAGTISVNPQMLILAIGLLAARHIAGWIGVDRFLHRKKT